MREPIRSLHQMVLFLPNIHLCGPFFLTVLVLYFLIASYIVLVVLSEFHFQTNILERLLFINHALERLLNVQNNFLHFNHIENKNKKKKKQLSASYCFFSWESLGIALCFCRWLKVPCSNTSVDYSPEKKSEKNSCGLVLSNQMIKTK